MNTNCNIIFNYVYGNIELEIDRNTTYKDLITIYAKKKDISMDNIKNYVFLANGDIIKTDSTDTITKLGKKTTILVYENMIDEPISEKSLVDKINNKQFINRNIQNSNIKIIDLLQDMAILGCLTTKLIQSTLLVKPDSFVLIEEAIKKEEEDPQLFILGMLAKYLNNLGIKTVIDRIPITSNEKNINLSNTVLQFLSNGLIFKKKFYLSFDLPKNIRQELLTSEKKKSNFNENIMKALKELYGIKEITITNPIPDKYYLLIVLIENETITLKKESLMSKFQNIPNLCTLTEVKEEKIIEGIILNKCMLDARGDNKDGNWGYYEQRGGEDYLPPSGWDRYGLNVFDKYDNRNNDWLKYDNTKGEWCIAYGWLTYDKDTVNLSKKYENDNDVRHNGCKVGKGIYCSQNPDIMEEFTQEVKLNGEKYKLGLMLRVNPDKFRCPENNDELWVVEGHSDEIRPYGLLIKKIEE